jgi:hypothetical protein
MPSRTLTDAITNYNGESARGDEYSTLQQGSVYWHALRGAAVSEAVGRLVLTRAVQTDAYQISL